MVDFEARLHFPTFAWVVALNAQLELVADHFVDGIFLAQEEFPAGRIGVEFVGKLFQLVWVVACGVDRETDQQQVFAVLGALLDFLHGGGDLRAPAKATGE